MKTKFEYVYFTKIYGDSIPADWYCHSNKGKGTFGIVKWDPKFKQHFYLPHSATAYPALCLNDISNFITILDNQ